MRFIRYHQHDHFIHLGPELGELFSLARDIKRKLFSMDDKITQGLTDIKSDIIPLRSAIDALIAKDTALAKQLATAIQSAKNAGASDEQLQDLTDFHAAFTTDIADLNSAALANTAAAGFTPAGTPGPTEDPNNPGVPLEEPSNPAPEVNPTTENAGDPDAPLATTEPQPLEQPESENPDA